MVQAQNDVGLRSSQFVTQPHERLVCESPFFVSYPLGVDEGHCPPVRDFNHPQGLHWTEYFSHDVRIIVVASEKISLPRSSRGKGERTSIGLVTAVFGYVARDDQDIDAKREGIHDRCQVVCRVVVPVPRLRIGEQMCVTQLR